MLQKVASKQKAILVFFMAWLITSSNYKKYIMNHRLTGMDDSQYTAVKFSVLWRTICLIPLKWFPSVCLIINTSKKKSVSYWAKTPVSCNCSVPSNFCGNAVKVCVCISVIFRGAKSQWPRVSYQNMNEIIPLKCNKYIDTI